MFTLYIFQHKSDEIMTTSLRTKYLNYNQIVQQQDISTFLFIRIFKKCPPEYNDHNLQSKYFELILALFSAKKIKQITADQTQAHLSIVLCDRRSQTRNGVTTQRFKIAAMGRKKIQISRITDERNRQVGFFILFSTIIKSHSLLITYFYVQSIKKLFSNIFLQHYFALV